MQSLYIFGGTPAHPSPHRLDPLRQQV